MKLRRKKKIHEAVEINITAFMNLMVILVPFLLITAVFSRMTVLELNLPSLNAANNEEDKKLELNLQLVVRQDHLQLQDPVLGPLKRFEVVDSKIDWPPITKVLLELKTRSPETTTISLLLDKDINYRTLIDVMDHVRSTQVVNVTSVEEYELFPDVAIGDAPVIGEAVNDGSENAGSENVEAANIDSASTTEVVAAPEVSTNE